MKGYIDGDLGRISIDSEVIARYAGSTAVECFGIVGMAAVSMKDGLFKLLKGDSLTRGINVKIDEDTGNIIGEFTPIKDEKIIRIVPISPTEIKTKSIINKEDIETKYGIVTYNPNKPNKKGND